MKSRIVQSIAAALSCAALGRAAEPIDFNRDVQPILSENCYQCHGPDAKAREADLRLDRKESAYRTLDDITPIKPGDSANSEAIIRIFSTDRDEMMPPPKSHRTLTEAQKQLLKRWVEEGAKWGEHWAFVAPKRPKVPGIADYGLRIADWERRDATRGAELRKQQARFETWAQNPIDDFVLDRLLREGLAPSPEAAARNTLPPPFSRSHRPPADACRKWTRSLRSPMQSQSAIL